MSNLKFDIDIDTLSKNLTGMKEEIKKDFISSAEKLAYVAHEEIAKLAKEELSSLEKIYLDNLKIDNPMQGFWVISLLEPALWIEEGRKSGFMEELLNGKSAKTGKNGKYAVIPFKHNKNPTEQSPKAYDLAKEIQYELKKKGVSWKKIEYNPDGSPRLGLIHRFDLETARPVDAQKSHHKTSLTKGVAVYQRKDDAGKVQKDVMTFRVISEKHKNEGLWLHPGRQGNKLFEKGFDYAMGIWERDILPAIFAKYKGK